MFQEREPDPGWEGDQVKTFSQAVEATLTSVREQMARCGSDHASSALLKRHATKHVGSSEPKLIGPVIEAVRDRLCEPVDAPETPCPFHSSGNEGRCNFCEDQ